MLAGGYERGEWYSPYVLELWAIREWPYSCNTTQTNSAAMTSAVTRAFVTLPLPW
jgi:hypothetical protein